MPYLVSSACLFSHRSRTRAAELTIPFWVLPGGFYTTGDSGGMSLSLHTSLVSDGPAQPCLPCAHLDGVVMVVMAVSTPYLVLPPSCCRTSLHCSYCSVCSHSADPEVASELMGPKRFCIPCSDSIPSRWWPGGRVVVAAYTEGWIPEFGWAWNLLLAHSSV